MGRHPHKHIKTVCKYCGHIIAKCRCLAINKEIIYKICETCKRMGHDAK